MFTQHFISLIELAQDKAISLFGRRKVQWFKLRLSLSSLLTVGYLSGLVLAIYAVMKSSFKYWTKFMEEPQVVKPTEVPIQQQQHKKAPIVRYGDIPKETPANFNAIPINTPKSTEKVVTVTIPNNTNTAIVVDNSVNKPTVTKENKKNDTKKQESKKSKKKNAKTPERVVTIETSNTFAPLSETEEGKTRAGTKKQRKDQAYRAKAPGRGASKTGHSHQRPLDVEYNDASVIIFTKTAGPVRAFYRAPVEGGAQRFKLVRVEDSYHREVRNLPEVPKEMMTGQEISTDARKELYSKLHAIHPFPEFRYEFAIPIYVDANKYASDMLGVPQAVLKPKGANCAYGIVLKNKDDGSLIVKPCTTQNVKDDWHSVKYTWNANDTVNFWAGDPVTYVKEKYEPVDPYIIRDQIEEDRLRNEGFISKRARWTYSETTTIEGDDIGDTNEIIISEDVPVEEGKPITTNIQPISERENVKQPQFQPLNSEGPQKEGADQSH